MSDSRTRLLVITGSLRRASFNRMVAQTLPERQEQLTDGRWLVCADGPFGEEIAADLHGAGLDADVRSWFDVHVPRPAVKRDFVARALSS